MPAPCSRCGTSTAATAGALCPACLLRLAAMPESRIPAFEIEALLGTGAGTTHLARTGTGSLVAVTTLEAPGLSSSAAAALDDLSGRLREFRDRAVAPFHGIEIDGDAVRLVRDYVRGRAFADWTASADAEAGDAARAVIAAALEAAHAQDLPHGHLVPANIVITGGRPVLLDLGTQIALAIVRGHAPDLEALAHDDRARLAQLSR